MADHPAATEEPLGTIAARGVGVLVGRMIGLQLLTAGVTVALAHILDPDDYGIFAVAQAAQILGLRFSEMGIAGAMLRRPQEPTEAEQKALLTFFLSIGLLICTVVFLVAFAVLPWSGLEEDGAQVVAVCLLAIPIYACRSVPMMLLERKLSFGRVALVETGETLAFNAFALAAALAGLGAFSLAGAIPAAALVGTLVAWRIQPFARGLTRHLAPVRPLIRFGIGLTTLQVVNLGGALAFVSALTAAGGASLAGFYALAQRLFAFPSALTSALLRVSYPALSRGAAVERIRRAGRAAVLASVVVGLPLALLAGAADPLINVLFGDEWLPVADLVVLGSAAMMLIAAAAVPMTSLFLAEGRPAPPVFGALLQNVVLVGGALSIARLTSTEVGALMAIAAALNVGLLAYRTEPGVRRALLTVLLALALSGIAAAAGRALGAGDDWAGLILSAGLTGAVWLALTALFMREPARDIWRLARPYLTRLRPSRFSASP
jgi:PST family polysaccharide transporter